MKVVYFSLLVFRGIYHYWKDVLLFPRGVKQIDMICPRVRVGSKRKLKN